MNKLQRYFIDQNADEDQRFFITNKEDIHHITNVMRNSVGNKVIVTFKNKEVYTTEITQITPQEIELKLIQKLDINTELPMHITICSGLIKSDKYEWMIQKATEMGASEFIAVEMDRSVAKLPPNKTQKKLERWQKIIKEAAEQSYRLIVPHIKFESNLNKIYDTISHYDYILLAYEDEAKRGEISLFKDALRQFKTNDRILIIFGPEGGFSEKEIITFKDVSTNVGLGPRILRAETAPLYALSAISFEKELMG
ncbi:16S rRNA (uracil(1498)-N(3))-methyltransferase [Staphylococcus caledonicus]|nr:16S rRNA (uracil(1498)-N(3))-methyltransferase [Staphylococcus sp. acrmy]